ncbi:MAG: MotA/TolQ/ExbB proton channel family protein [Campylobacterota bacterium]|nr:MotA/TolQ/ExbB proton channel family protein [Campylobacterota bacterium]
MNSIATLLETGGDVLIVLFFFSTLFWTLVVEKSLYHKSTYKPYSKKLKKFWKMRGDKQNWENQQVIIAQISELKLNLQKNLSIMQVVIALFPLLGLLGTITGMISVFDSMNTLGTNAKAMASGISMATIPTMAGMLLAIFGLFAFSRIHSIVSREIRLLQDKLLRDSDA